MNKQRVTQIAVFAVGLFNTLTVLWIFAAPQHFFETVAHFHPYNRHFLWDAGAFLLPISVGLMIAARDPVRYRLLIGVATAASVIHTLNHVVDATGEPLTHWLMDITPLAILAIALTLVLTSLREAEGTATREQPRSV